MLLHTPSLQHHDQISVANGAQSMRDDKGSSITHQVCQALLNCNFTFNIKVAGGFIKN